MSTKGNSGSRRWIERRPIDSRPIVSEYDVPRWQRELERIAPLGCYCMAGLTLGIAALAWGVDLIAGHIR